jgi:micrococcal nuclease
MYEYRCTIIKIVDGDTVDVDIDLGFDVILKNQRIRVHGIDTPESRTSDKLEKVFGLAAKEKVKSLIPVGTQQVLRTIKDRDDGDARGKFGRILGDFLVNYEGEDQLLTDIMIDEHHAVSYHGQNKDDIEQQHLNNRKVLIDAGTISIDNE